VDQTKLVNHLNAGKKLYIDGVDLGWHNDYTAFYKMLGANCIADGYTLSSIKGQQGTITDGKIYAFLSTDYDANSYIDEISAASGATLIFKCNQGKGRGVSYEHPAKKYRVIYTSFNFCGIRGIPEKKALMKIYMDWLTGGTDINQDQLALIANSLFITSTFGENRINFSLALPARISINLYTVTGKLVTELVDNKFNAGSHQLGLKSTIRSGNYVLSVKADNWEANKAIFILR